MGYIYLLWCNKKFFYKFHRNIESENFNIPTCRLDSDLISKKWYCVFEQGPPKSKLVVKYKFMGFSLKNFRLGKVNVCRVFFFCSDSMHLSYQDVLFPYTSFSLKSRYFKVCPTRQWYSGKGSKMTLSQVLLTHSSFWVCSKSLKIDSSELQTPL